MIVRWGLASYPGILAELGIRTPLLITTRRWDDLDLPAAARYSGVRQHAPLEMAPEIVKLVDRRWGDYFEDPKVGG